MCQCSISRSSKQREQLTIAQRQPTSTKTESTVTNLLITILIVYFIFTLPVVVHDIASQVIGKYTTTLSFMALLDVFAHQSIRVFAKFNYASCKCNKHKDLDGLKLQIKKKLNIDV